MKKPAMVFVAWVCWAAGLAFAQVDTITVLHLNDTHSVLAPIGPRTPALEGTLGGIARAATVIGQTRAERPGVLLLHAGDLCIGDIFYNQYFGVPELQMLGALGCDAMAVGNHEFDLGPSTLQTALDTAFSGGGFPLVSANLVLEDPAVSGLKTHIHPWTIRQVGAVRIGIFGLITPSTNVISSPAPAFADTNIIPIAAAMVDTLRNAGCNVVICLSHLGIALDRAIAAYIPGISAIIGGHDHYRTSTPEAVTNPLGDTTWIAQANAFYLDIGRMTFTIEGSSVRLLEYESIPLDSGVPEEPAMAGIVSTLISGIEAQYGPIYSFRLGTVSALFDEVADSLDAPGMKDTPIGNLVADALRAATGTAIAIEAGGSTAQPLYPGPIVPADAFRVVGYGFNTDNGLGFRLATFDIAGAALVGGLEIGVADLSADEFLIQVSGMSYKYDSALPPYGRVWEVTVNGLPIDPGTVYSVTANESIPLLLDYFGVPYSNLHVLSDTSEFQVLSGYIAAIDTLVPHQEGRIVCETSTSVGGGSPEQPSAFRLEQNYPNPFNGETRIQYAIHGRGNGARVTLAVFDMLGRKVATLVDEQQPEGVYTVAFNAAEFPSGVYIYRLQIGSLQEAKKMVLLR
jgi:5'-nucleotidase / UDP-sugar diphosphatase